MALHGTFEVNGRPIGHWTAVRETHLSLNLPDGENFYRVEVEVRGKTVRDTLVVHRYADGPLVLAAKALSAVAATDDARQAFATPRHVLVKKP